MKKSSALETNVWTYKTNEFGRNCEIFPIQIPSETKIKGLFHKQIMKRDHFVISSELKDGVLSTNLSHLDKKRKEFQTNRKKTLKQFHTSDPCKVILNLSKYNHFFASFASKS